MIYMKKYTFYSLLIAACLAAPSAFAEPEILPLPVGTQVKFVHSFSNQNCKTDPITKIDFKNTFGNKVSEFIGLPKSGTEVTHVKYFSSMRVDPNNATQLDCEPEQNPSPAQPYFACGIHPNEVYATSSFQVAAQSSCKIGTISFGTGSVLIPLTHCAAAIHIECGYNSGWSEKTFNANQTDEEKLMKLREAIQLYFASTAQFILP